MHRRPHLSTLIALACALFLRVWVPAGWMPASSGELFAIEPCIAAAPAPAVHSMHHHGTDAPHHDPSHKTQHNGDCSFAPHHAGFTSVDHTPVIWTKAAAVEPAHRAAVTPFLATGPPAPPPPATGPPALA